ncbi:tetratricopeptide repeat protein [Butyrivibrio proteoclasticus]|uniref:tetratricopeptide repeat protein n=1 Tax=Butyrivibrio proteoclasticus TaxID=43305 RepID=UPI0005578E29|nr:tetratricopeptide repeat protein [Butyrivibrio proteoclasticus]
MIKILAMVLGTAVAVVLVFAIYNQLPFVKVSKAIAAGDKYSESADYESAIDYYSKAINIDSGSVTAYCNMAGAYLSMDDAESAKQILYKGWQNTSNEGLLDNYHTVILNQAVSDMNSGKTDLSTVMSIVSVLEEDPTNESAVELLNSAYSRCFTDSYSEDTNCLFRADYISAEARDAGAKTYTFEEYKTIVEKLVSVYTANPNDALKEVVLKYAVPGSSSFTLNCSDVEGYSQLIASVEGSVGTNEEIATFKECLSNSVEVLSVFDGIFQQLDVGNVDELRDFIVTDEYISLRDVFLNHQETVQENTTYIPISREAMILEQKDGSWQYRFLDFDENPTTKGVITVWANFFEDDEVQRTAISYEPQAIEDNYYPHTKYTVTYLYSYITSGGSTKVAKMNYRLDTSITTQDGEINSTVVGDWGGPNEWVMDIDTIESRIRA